MKNMVVILFDTEGDMSYPQVTLYDEIHDPIPYIKKMLKNWDIYDDKFQKDLNSIETVEDAQVLIEENAIYTMQIHIVNEVNPEV